MGNLNVLVVCGGRSPEHQISLLSAANVVAALRRGAQRVCLVGICKSGEWRRYDPDNFLLDAGDAQKVRLANPLAEVALVVRSGRPALIDLYADGAPGSVDPQLGQGQPAQPAVSAAGAHTFLVDVVFPVMHGEFGEDGAIQGICKMAGVPFVGCDVASSAICMDKDIAKQLLDKSGIPTARARVFRPWQRGGIDFVALAAEFAPPFFVKPARLGSSFGVAKVEVAEKLAAAVDLAFNFDDKILVEQGIIGREIECAVLGNENPEASAPGEIVPRGGFYSFEAKYVDADAAALEAPAKLDAATGSRVQSMALAAYKALGCEGMARVDFFLTPEGKLLVNELNTIPGFTQISMFPRLWELSGVPYPELVERLIRLALERRR